jgi:hypothetical protein
MENYKIVKDNVNKKLLFKMSQIGYALHCDLLFTNRIPEIVQDINLVNHLKNGDKIFISVLQHELTINLVELVNILHRNNIKVYFYLMYEPIVPENIVKLLLPVSFNLKLNVNNKVVRQFNVCYFF